MPISPFIRNHITASAYPAPLDIELFAVTVTGGVGYAVVNDDSNRVDLIAGARYLWLDVDLDFDIGALKEKASDSGSEIDGIVGFRARTKLADRWVVS